MESGLGRRTARRTANRILDKMVTRSAPQPVVAPKVELKKPTHRHYDYLMEEYEKRGPGSFDLFVQSAGVTSIQRTLPPKTAEALAYLIYSLMIHHDKLHRQGQSFRRILYDGQNASSQGGCHFETNNIPVVLYNLIFILVEQVDNRTYKYMEELK